MLNMPCIKQLAEDYEKLSIQRKWELIIMSLFLVFCISAFFLMFSSFKNSIYDEGTLKEIREQNKLLEVYNTQLNSTIKSLTFTIMAQTKKDSIKIAIERNNNAAIGNIDDKLNQINKKYENQNLSRFNNYQSSDILRYFSEQGK